MVRSFLSPASRKMERHQVQGVYGRVLNWPRWQNSSSPIQVTANPHLMQKIRKALHQPGNIHTWKMVQGLWPYRKQEEGETGSGPASLVIVIWGKQTQHCLSSANYSSHTTGYVQHTNLNFYIMIHRSSPAIILVVKGCDTSSWLTLQKKKFMQS